MEIYINVDDIEMYIKKYINSKKDLVFKNYIKILNKDEYLCSFFLKGIESKVRFYHKKNKGTVKMIPVGKEKDASGDLIMYISQQGYNIKGIKPEQITIKCSQEILNNLVEYINEELFDKVKVEFYNNRIKFIGYNNDHVNIIYYSTVNKILIQGRPFEVYSIIVTYLASLETVTLDDVVELNNIFSQNECLKSNDIREKMKYLLTNSYKYMDEALLKSLSGSLSSLEIIKNSEDYTGCVTGAFKMLEGYLTKILIEKYNYNMKTKTKFSMFYIKPGDDSEINKSPIPKCEKDQLNILYKIYSNKRNVFLHSDIDVKVTRIISTWDEANDIVQEIIEQIEESYKIIM